MSYDVCVFGGCSIDKEFFQKDDGSYPNIPQVQSFGGKGSNQAVASSRSGAKVTIITRIGNDDNGKKIIENLQANGIDTSYVDLIDGLGNDISFIYVDKNSDNDIKRQSCAINSFTPDMIDKYSDILLSSKIISIQFKIPKEVSIKLIDFCYKHKKTLILTPSPPMKLKISEEGNLELIDKVSLITSNEDEFKTMFENNNIEECVAKYPNKLIVTLGENGVIYNNGVQTIRIPAIKITNVVDSTGAGDTFNGNLAHFLSQGNSLDFSIRRAVYASAMQIQQKGAQKGMPTKKDLEKFIFGIENKLV